VSGEDVRGIRSRPKYVVSRSLERVTWNNSSLIKGDVVTEIRKLRQQPGRTVHTWGSAEVQSQPSAA
jgi:hypothetical protein